MVIYINKSKTVMTLFSHISKQPDPGARQIRQSWSMIFSLCERFLALEPALAYIDISEMTGTPAFRLALELEKYPRLAAYIGSDSAYAPEQAIRDLIACLLKTIRIDEETIYFQDFRPKATAPDRAAETGDAPAEASVEALRAHRSLPIKQLNTGKTPPSVPPVDKITPPASAEAKPMAEPFAENEPDDPDDLDDFMGLIDY